MTEEMNAIQHLLEVEAEASLLVAEAQKKADARISQARAQSEEEFKATYAEFSKKLESQELAQKEAIAKEQKAVFGAYAKSLDSTPKDKAAFNDLLETLLRA